MEDFDGWEVLPDDGFLQIHDDGGKRIYSRSYGPGSRCVYKDYFICPDSKSTKFVENTEQEQQEEQYPRSRVVSLQLENSPDHNQEDLKIITEAPFEKAINQSPPLLLENLKETEESDPDPDPVLQVLYKKMMEPEFVDMKKLESPTRNMKPPPFPVDSTTFQLVDEGKGESFDMKISSPNSLMKVEEEKIITHSGSGNNNGGFNIWKWSLTTGIGAICSFGIATATVCIIFLGAQQRNTTKQQQSKEKRNLQFHIYTDEKKLKEAAMRGSGRAHITFGGGYYDELFE